MGDQLWATETSWTFADFYRAAECSVEDQLSATRRLPHAPRTGHWAKLTATESMTMPEQLLPQALSRIFKRCRCSAEEKTPLIARSKHTRQMKDSRWSEKVSRFQLLCSVKSPGTRSPASLSVWKTRSVLGYILKDFRGWPKLWDVGQQIIKIKEYWPTRHWDEQKGCHSQAISATMIHFLKYLLPVLVGRERGVRGICKPQDLEFNPEMGKPSGWKGQRSFRNVLEALQSLYCH